MFYSDGFSRKDLASSHMCLTDIKGFAHYTIIDVMKNVKEQTTMVLKRIDE